MLIIWFIIVLTLSIVLVIMGYALKQAPLAICGAGLLLLLGQVVMFGNIEVKTGYVENVIAPCDNNCTTIRQGDTLDLYSVTNTSVSFVYSPIQEEEVIGIGISHLLGFFLSLIAIFLFIDVMLQLGGKIKQ
jgi:hypothetical protein